MVNARQVEALEQARLENRHATVTATLEAEVASLKRQLAASQEKLLAFESKALYLEKCLGELEVARSMSLEALEQKWRASLEVAQLDASHKDQRVTCLEAENGALVEEHVRLMRSIAVLAEKGPVEAEAREHLDAPVDAGGGLLLAQLWRQNRDLQARLDAALNVSFCLQHGQSLVGYLVSSIPVKRCPPLHGPHCSPRSAGGPAVAGPAVDRRAARWREGQGPAACKRGTSSSCQEADSPGLRGLVRGPQGRL